MERDIARERSGDLILGRPGTCDHIVLRCGQRYNILLSKQEGAEAQMESARAFAAAPLPQASDVERGVSLPLRQMRGVAVPFLILELEIGS